MNRVLGNAIKAIAMAAGILIIAALLLLSMFGFVALGYWLRG